MFPARGSWLGTFLCFCQHNTQLSYSHQSVSTYRNISHHDILNLNLGISSLEPFEEEATSIFIPIKKDPLSPSNPGIPTQRNPPPRHLRSLPTRRAPHPPCLQHRQTRIRSLASLLHPPQRQSPSEICQGRFPVLHGDMDGQRQ